MIPFYIYDTGNGRILALGSYDERGDGAAARAVAAGTINPTTEYAPGGVKTARPTVTSITLNKTTIVGNGVDTCTFSGIPTGAQVAIYKDQDFLPRAVGVITDGTLVLTVDAVGSYAIVFSGFPVQEVRFTVTAT